MRRLVLWVVLAGAACADERPWTAHVCVSDAGGATLRVLPGDFVDWWVTPDSRRQFFGQVSRADCARLGKKVAASSDQPWLTAELQSDEEAALRRLVLTVDAAQLPKRLPGDDGGYDQALVTVTANGQSAQTRVRVRVIDLLELHVGPADGACVRPGSTTCDFVNIEPTWQNGFTALNQAVAAYPDGGLRIFLYDNFGDPATLDKVTLPADTWVSNAPGVSPHRLIVSDNNGNVITLGGNRVHLSGVTISARWQIDAAITTRSSGAEAATTGHLIENVIVAAYNPPCLGFDVEVMPFIIGADTVVRNNYIHGNLAGWINLRNASGSRVLHNTVVHYGDAQDAWVVEGASDLVIANNTVLVLTRPLPVWLLGDGSGDITVSGNIIEGYEAAADGVAVGDNVVGELEVESPRVPKFLADSEQRISPRWSGEGTSMDGLDISGRLDIRPGAFQQPSSRTSPRRMVVRIGASCGDQPCDLSVAEPDGLQRAVWSAWPGGTVEVYPSPARYSKAAISWGMTVVGMGSPWETRVGSGWTEEPLRSSAQHISAALAVAPGILDPVHVANLTLSTSDVGLAHQAHRDRPSRDRHLFEHLVIVRDNASGLDPAVTLGHNALLRDVLVDGTFGSCVELGDHWRLGWEGPTPVAAWISNLTCRLRDYGTEQPRVAFWVGGLLDALLANIVVEGPAGLSMFGAQIDQDGAGTAVIPQRFTARAISFRGFDPLYFQFAESDGTYDLEDLVDVPDGDPLIAADGRLEAGAHAIDAGVDPASSASRLARFAVGLGSSLDGVARAGRVVDQGAFEQGN